MGNKITMKDGVLQIPSNLIIPFCGGNAPEGRIMMKDVITDAFLQQILTRSAEYDVVATMNLNGDYISDAYSDQVVGIGFAPGADINYITGTAISKKIVTNNFAGLMDDAVEVSTSEFGDSVIENMC